MTRGPTSIIRRKLIRELKKLSRETGRRFWRRVAEELSRPRRQRRAVNVSRINRYAKNGEVIVVPGKVLGAGILEKKVTVLAESFSEKAYHKIIEAGGKPILLSEVLENKEKIKELTSGPIRIIG